MFFLSTQRIKTASAAELCVKALCFCAEELVSRLDGVSLDAKRFVAVSLSVSLVMPMAPAFAQSDSAGMPPTAPKIVKPSNRSDSARSAASAVQEQHPQLDTAPKVPTRTGTDSGARPGSNSGDRIARPGQSQAVSGQGSDSERINRPSDPYRISRPGSSSSTSQPSYSSSNSHETSTSKAGLSSLGSSSSKSNGSSRSGTTSSSSSQAPKTAPPIGKSGSNSPATAGGAGQSSATDMYPQIGKLEQLTFGTSKPDLQIEERLISLESAVFAKTYANDSLFDRTERLKITLLGKGPAEPQIGVPDEGLDPPGAFVDNPMANNSPDPAELAYLDEIIDRPDSYQKSNRTILDAYALELINYERQRRALGNLQHNHLAQKMADEQIRDLAERGVVSHNNSKGDNPDRRYTLLGGVDAVNETLAILNTAELNTSHLCKAAVAKSLKQLLMQQDDREALLAPEATHIGFAIEPMNQGAQIISCIEIVTNRGTIEHVPKTARVGDKIEVQGTIAKPYVFERITLAWEGVSDLPPQEDNSSEPLPYFPPLDFVAYKQKSEKDHSKAIFALKTAGMLAAIAGGMFVPPVALAAPLIMMAGPDPGEVKPVSDVPVKGGVKVSGDSFSSKVTVSNDGKEGLYYLTVWANMGADDKAVAISRRTILVKQVHDEEDVEGKVSIPKEESSGTKGDGTVKPTDSGSDSAESSTKPFDSNTKPVDFSTKPSDVNSKPVETGSDGGSNSADRAEQSSLQATPSALGATTAGQFEIGKPGDPFAPEKKDANDKSSLNDKNVNEQSLHEKPISEKSSSAKSETEKTSTVSTEAEGDTPAEMPTSRQSRYSYSSDDSSGERD